MKISQREARRLKKRVAELEQKERDQRSNWCRTYPGGICLGTWTMDVDWFRGRLEAARMLGHPLVVTLDQNKASFYAVECC